MKFNLTYEGSLPSSGNKPKNEDKWRIRKHFHPQLLDLWKNHPALKRTILTGRYFPIIGGATIRQVHHLHPGVPILHGPESPDLPIDRGVIDLCEPIVKHGAVFSPLVRETFALHCGLKILFLRREGPGRVYQGGDIDGRIKTLLDALAMPQHVEQVLERTTTGMAPMHVLLEDDSRVSGLTVESERLLGAEGMPEDYAKLTIEVDVRVREALIYNQSFLS